MLKYQKRWLCKALSIILAVAMLLTAPIGMTQAYALEGEQFKVTDVQGELPLGESEGTEPDEVLDSGASEVTSSDAEETGLERSPAPPPDGNEIQSRGVPYGLPAEIEAGTVAELEDALNNLADANTIKLTADINYNKGIVIDGITMAFDVGQYKLNITNSDTSGTGCGLEVKNGGRVTLLYTTGELNTSGHYYGVKVNGSSTATITNATATGANGYGAFAVDNSEITVLGDAEAAENGSDGVVAWQSSNITVRGNATGNSLAAKTESYSTIHIEGDATTNGTETGDVGVFASSNGKITVDGVINVKKAENYVRVNGANFTIDSKMPSTTKSGYHTYMHPSYTGPEDSVVWVKKAEIPSTITEVGTPEELKVALDNLSDGDTIKLMENIDYEDSVYISKAVTFDVGQYTLNITAIQYDYLTGLEVTGSVSLISTTGELNVTGSRIGVMVSNGEAASATVTNATATQPDGIGIHATSVQPKTSSVIVQGNVNAPHTGVYAFGSGSSVTVHGNINSAGVGAEAESDASIVVYGDIESESYGVKIVSAGRIIAGKDITTTGADSIGAWIKEAGSVRIDGDITAVNYIKLGSTIKLKSDGVADPDLSGYTKYTDVNDRVVRVKGVVVPSGKVCEIGEIQYSTLSEALEAVPSGGTITLLQNITHTKHIMVEKKAINFDLMDYDLLLDTSADVSYSPALMVIDGGKVNLIGSGTGEFNIKSYTTAISAIGINSKATVHNVVAGDGTGVRMVGSGDYLDSKSTVIVLGSITVGNGNGVSVNAKDGKVVVGGNIVAGRVGVDIASNPGTQVTVNGDITVDGDSSIAGIWAYGATTVAVTGNVTVRGTNCVGVHASGSTIKIDGNVVSSGKGAHSDTNGKVEITGGLTAGTPFITVGTTDMTTDQGTKIGGGSLLYTDGANTVQIGSSGISVPTYTITVQNDGHGTGGASLSSAEAGTEIILIVTPSSGYVFKEWQVISSGVTITGNKFTMPANNVTVKAIFEETAATTYTVTVNNGSGGREYAKDAIVTITANDRSGYDFNKWVVKSGTITLKDSRSRTTTFIMPAGEVTVEATYTNESSSSSNSGVGIVKTDGSITPKAVEFDKNTEGANNKDIKVTLSSSSYTLSDIKLKGKTLVKGTDYTVSESTVTIKKQFLSELGKGEYTFTFDMNGGSDPVLKLVVSDTKKQETKADIPFADVTASDWFSDSVMWVYEKGLISGTSTEPMLFSPYENTTRGMLVTILYRLAGEPTAFGNPFDDVPDDAYCADAVRWAYAEKIVDGYGGGKFGPNDAITREQLAVILMNYAKLKGNDLSAVTYLAKYSDADTVSDWALEAMIWANAERLINGDSSKLMPKGNAQRAQAAAILQRFHEMYVK